LFLNAPGQTSGTLKNVGPGVDGIDHEEVVQIEVVVVIIQAFQPKRLEERHKENSVARFFIIPKREKIYQITTKCTKFQQNVPNFNKMYQISTKCTKFQQNVPNVHKIYQLAVIHTKWP
jgi:hypothetical protein